ncbi:hypothetical protein O7A05_10000 [Mesorhizobium sp. Cs1330R2N1]|uniref:Uncharacterized protein n=1 Tax=Mesorhizobium argentiipisi TaxID=3015175 RepID=A0ABU8KBE8_9HYPH
MSTCGIVRKQPKPVHAGVEMDYRGKGAPQPARCLVPFLDLVAAVKDGQEVRIDECLRFLRQKATQHTDRCPLEDSPKRHAIIGSCNKKGLGARLPQRERHAIMPCPYASPFITAAQSASPAVALKRL